MPATEPISSADQIKIPNDFPEILKNYSKFIIKEQPRNIKVASAEYFSRIAKISGSEGEAGIKRLNEFQLEALHAKLRGHEDEIDEADIRSIAGKSQLSETTINEIFTYAPILT